MKTIPRILFVVTTASSLALSAYAGDKAAERDDPTYPERRASTDADNTSRNNRDRDNASVTPLDQGNSKADLDTTQRIRREIENVKEFSTDAKNVKVITNGGHVTLRGPVDSAEEKQRISTIAATIASPANVDCQLEVKTGANSR